MASKICLGVTRHRIHLFTHAYFSVNGFTLRHFGWSDRAIIESTRRLTGPPTLPLMARCVRGSDLVRQVNQSAPLHSLTVQEPVSWTEAPSWGPGRRGR